HLKQFYVDQNWDKYSPIDHAVWRYIMRQAVHILRENAHRIYFEGLLNTGINLDAIPKIEDMNDILGRIGWGAVAVDGFIPPAAFMEYQAHRVLVIACDMRQINHIEYTPAPDIVHEAAGHAPIIVDGEYADYLQRFGEVGAKAMSSRKDFELYEAIRHLSILKEAPNADPNEVEEARKLVELRQANLGAPSEMARLSRLHWWTVEYGLIGDLETPKIYGAGLLSSIGEAVSCLDEGVKKIPYSLAAADVPFDITTKQPQLFVTPDFEHLNRVLDEFVSTMAWTVGGASGLTKAIECNNVSTAVYSSGLQVTGIFVEQLPGKENQPSYIRTQGPSALACDHHELPGQGKEYHKDGFSSPVGKLKNVTMPLEEMSDSDLAAHSIRKGEACDLTFDSGITVSGRLEKITRANGKLILLSFADCAVTAGDKLLFKPEWGIYDMAVGEKIVSVFHGAADKDAYEQVALVPRERTIKVQPDLKTRKLYNLYQHIREIRDGKSSTELLPELWKILLEEHREDWLASLDILEIMVKQELHRDLQPLVREWLDRKAAENPANKALIEDGLKLLLT
ncbi:MAG: aromatic amino acid hydroxylase, partial [candidate division Zixibacteria bacterium]|nr:aromatic amino acid hydroxylase [candidate division Zixibacteria bacterium]